MVSQVPFGTEGERCLDVTLFWVLLNLETQDCLNFIWLG